MSTKTHEFKAEIQQILDLVIHSLYSKKEVFLRELISNASDAIEQAQYLGLTDKTLLADAPQWQIDLIADKENKVLTVADNGIGMDAQELEQNLGTIANSGTKAFAKAIQEAQGSDIPELIGQFGVGFYAAFMVADEVTVITLKRGANQTAVKWHSTGANTYTLEESTREKPGTTIILKLREDMDQYLDEWQLRELVKRYSDFIAYPIRFGAEGQAAAADAEPMNTMKALWKLPKKELTPEATNTFYSHLTHDYTPPLKTIHMAVEGVVEFKALLFIPKALGFELMMPNAKHGLQLYVRNVFIGADLEMLLPEYLRFVKGVVDSSDLPLNVSREMLQDDAVIRKIKSNITGKILGTLAEMQKENDAEYKEFYASFGRILKEGLHLDYANADKLKGLLMFHSARDSDNALITLEQYISDMPASQDKVYYLQADDLATAKHSPHLEALLEHGYDALLLTDPIDQWVVDALREVDGKALVAIDKGELELGSSAERTATKQKVESAAKDFKELTEYIQEQLKDEVAEVRFSPRLANSACCLVADEQALNASMERLMRAMNQDVPQRLRILELNPDHNLVKRMQQMVTGDSDKTLLSDYVELLYGQALLSEGSAPKNPQRFTQLVADLMARG